ncbi:MAG: hypothetical protein PUI29_10675 [Aeromonadales bacterium]|nr:hypothetical protein [Aeromonadales bacterium]MDY2890164.1 hypothetical protein [Succinivibrio sp.]
MVQTILVFFMWCKDARGQGPARLLLFEMWMWFVVKAPAAMTRREFILRPQWPAPPAGRSPYWLVRRQASRICHVAAAAAPRLKARPPFIGLQAGWRIFLLIFQC